MAAAPAPVAVAPASAAEPARDEGWIFELGVGFGGGRSHTAYARRLRDFGFEGPAGRHSDLYYALSAGRRLHQHMVVGLTFCDLDAREFTRENDELTQHFDWITHAFGAWLQGDIGLGRRTVNLFARAGGGVTVATTAFDEVVVDDPTADDRNLEITAHLEPDEERFMRYYLAASGGLHIMPWDNVGFLFEYRYVYAPAIENLFGETHDAGAGVFLTGVRVRSWELP